MSDADTADLAEEAAPSVDEGRLREMMGHFCTGVSIITAVDEGEPVGFTAQSFLSLSLDPPLMLFCPQKTSSSWPRIQNASSFCVNVLNEEQEALCRTFASKGADKFRGVGWRPGPRSGAPVLDDVLAWAEGRIVAEHDGGDHLIVVGEVLDVRVEEHDAGPLLFYRGGFGRFES